MTTDCGICGTPLKDDLFSFVTGEKVGATAVYSILRDWIKGQTTAIETGVLSFEGAFLGQILLPSGKTILETVEHQKMLPAPRGE